MVADAIRAYEDEDKHDDDDDIDDFYYQDAFDEGDMEEPDRHMEEDDEIEADLQEEEAVQGVEMEAFPDDQAES